MTSTPLVFVYGTLKKGFPNHARFMRGARYVGEGRTRDRFPLIVVGERWVPCLVDRAGEGYRVEGELFEVDEATLVRLDWLEGTDEPQGYRRRTIAVEMEGATPRRVFEAETYLMAPDDPLDARSGPLQSYDKKAAERYRPRTDR